MEILYEKAVVDRVVDGKHVVLLVGKHEVEKIIPLGVMPSPMKEGQFLKVRFEEGVLLEALIDTEGSEQVRQRVQSKMEQLRRRGRSGCE